MPRKSSTPQTEEQMVVSESKRIDNKLHGGKRAGLTSLSKMIQDDLSTIEAISLVNGSLETIKERTIEYLQVCSSVGTMPSILGLARCLGHSRQSLYKFLNEHPQTPIAKFLEIVRDSISEMLDSAALTNCVNPVAAIFVLKSIYQRIDRAELTINRGTATYDGDEDAVTLEELRAKYMQSIPAPEDD